MRNTTTATATAIAVLEDIGVILSWKGETHKKGSIWATSHRGETWATSLECYLRDAYTVVRASFGDHAPRFSSFCWIGSIQQALAGDFPGVDPFRVREQMRSLCMMDHLGAIDFAVIARDVASRIPPRRVPCGEFRWLTTQL